MSRSIGFLGCGKIGRAVLAHARERGCPIAFVQSPSYEAEAPGEFPVLRNADRRIYQRADLVVECATAEALEANFDDLIACSDVMVFSLTAFSREEFASRARQAARAGGHQIYIPHGAILGLDGIRDARNCLTSVQIETMKSPKSLGLTLSERTVVYDGSTRGACAAFPRNVNVHAAVALAGIGFDRTRSRVVADPAVDTNTHIIRLAGEGIAFTLEVSSFAAGGVTGVYTPLSACGSLDRYLGGQEEFVFV